MEELCEEHHTVARVETVHRARRLGKEREQSAHRDHGNLYDLSTCLNLSYQMSRIESLPTDSDLPTSDEEDTLRRLYPDVPLVPTPDIVRKSGAVLRGFRHELRQCAIIIGLFVLFTWSGTEACLGQLFPFAARSSIVLYVLKIVLVVVLYMLVSNACLLWIQ